MYRKFDLSLSKLFFSDKKNAFFKHSEVIFEIKIIPKLLLFKRNRFGFVKSKVQALIWKHEIESTTNFISGPK